jgi:putative transposase
VDRDVVGRGPGSGDRVSAGGERGAPGAAREHRLRLTDEERWRLAKLGKALGRKALQQLATIATPDTILRWYRELVAAKYDGSKKRGPGRPTKDAEIVRLLVENGHTERPE